MSQRVQPFPANCEAPLILREVANGDRVVYLESCTCLPLVDDIKKRLSERGQLALAGRNHEEIPVQDDWATLLIGECVLDEFRNSKRAFSEFSRILTPQGRLLVSGPVRPTDAEAFEDTPNPESMKIMSLNRVSEELEVNGFVQQEITDLSKQVLESLQSTNRYRRLADAMSDNSDPLVFVLVKAVKIQIS